MALQTSTLRPGVLVSLKTSLVGGVAYDKRIIERDRVTKDGKRKAKWETERTINDPEEFETAAQTRLKCRSLVGSVCAHSAFGWLCPEDKEDALAEAIAEARKLAEDFNATARTYRVSFYPLTGRIAQDDVEAVRAINSEVRDLMEVMEDGLKNADVDAIRSAAGKLRSVGQMLLPAKQKEAQDAIEVARAAARRYVKAGEQAAQEIDREAVKAMTVARRGFLDLEEAATIARPKGARRVVDLTPTKGAAVKRPSRARVAEVA